MSWIDDRIKQREAAHRRSVLIDEGAPIIFNNLWGAITPWVEEAKKKNMPVFTNGIPYERVVILSTPGRPGQSRSEPKHLTLSLAKDRSGIVVDGIGWEAMKLIFDINNDGAVCIKQNGAEVSISDLAISLLDQFFFPEFAHKESL